MSILIVDNDPASAAWLCAGLEARGMAIRTAVNGERALSDLLGTAPGQTEVILLDLIMPTMDGWRFREIQRDHPRLSDLPVIAMAEGDPDPSSLRSYGMEVFFRKPPDLDQLAAKIWDLAVDRPRIAI